MKTLNLFFIVLIFLPWNLNGQPKDSLDNSQILNLEEVISIPNQGFILFKTDSVEAPTVLDFSYFNLDNELVSTVRIPTSRTNEFFALEKIFIWNNKLIICSSLYQPGHRKNHLLYYEYSLPDLTLTTSKVLLETIAPRTVYVPYFINISPDSSKLVAVGWDYNAADKNAEIKAKVFDKNLTVEKQQDYDLPYKNERLAINEVFVDNTSKIYIVGDNYKGSLKGWHNPAKINHFVVGLFPGEKGKLWPIQKDKHPFSQIKYTLNQAQTLIGLGAWAKGINSGVGFIKITKDGLAPIISNLILYKDFKNAYKKNLPTFSTPANKFMGYEFTHLLCKKDGYVLVAENQGHQLQYADILVIKFSTEGNITWVSRIPKLQNILRIEEKFGSFSLLEFKEKLYFLFNDTHLNYKNGNNEYIKAASVLNAKPAMAELTLSTGAIKRKRLEKLLSKDYVFLPRYCQKTSKEHIIIIGTGVFSNAGKFHLKKVKIKAAPK